MNSKLILHVETRLKCMCDTITRDDASRDQNKGIYLKKSLKIMKNSKAVWYEKEENCIMCWGW